MLIEQPANGTENRVAQIIELIQSVLRFTIDQFIDAASQLIYEAELALLTPCRERNFF